MAYRPQLDASPPSFPLRVCVLSPDARALEAALREDSRLAPGADAADADVLLWEAGASLPQELQSPRARPWIALVEHPDQAARMLEHGARGVLSRAASGPSLTAAVVAVRMGLCVLDLSVAEPCVHLAEPAPQPSAADLEALTQREREVLEALALGLSNRVIADRLGVSVHTVKFHVNSILAKLQVDTRAGAVAKALRRGVLRT